MYTICRKSLQYELETCVYETIVFVTGIRYLESSNRKTIVFIIIFLRIYENS